MLQIFKQSKIVDFIYLKNKMEECKEKYEHEGCHEGSHFEMKCPNCGCHMECGHMHYYKKMAKGIIMFLIIAFLVVVLFKVMSRCSISDQSWSNNNSMPWQNTQGQQMQNQQMQQNPNGSNY